MYKQYTLTKAFIVLEEWKPWHTKARSIKEVIAQYNNLCKGQVGYCKLYHAQVEKDPYLIVETKHAQVSRF